VHPEQQPMIARARILGVCVALLAGAALASPGVARAEGKAAELYQEGVRLLKERRAEDALQALDASLALEPSVNASLVRAHALRLLGRRVDAMSAYARVVEEAGERVRAGDERLKDTLADAGRWMALLRAEVGEVSVEVARAPEGAILTIDGKP